MVIIVIMLLFLSAPVVADTKEGWYESFPAEDGKELADLQDDDFQSIEEATINKGFVRDGIWLKRDFSATEDHILWLDNHLLNRIEVWVLQGDSVLSHQVGGVGVPRAERSNVHPENIFTIPALDSLRIFMKVTANEDLRFNLVLMPVKQSHTILSEEAIVSMLPTGMMLALFFIYLFIFLSLRDLNLMPYLLFIFASILSNLKYEGYLFFYFFPYLPDIAPYTTSIDAFASITAAVFALQFLRLRNSASLAYKIILALIYLQVLCFFMGILGFGYIGLQITNLVATIYLLFALPLTVYLWVRKRLITAQYYLYSLIVLTIGVALFFMRNYGVIGFENIVLNHALQIALAVEMVVIGIGIARQIELLRKSKLRVEEENIRIITEQNQRLEALVKQRTQELDEKFELIRHQKEEIEALNEDLEQIVKERTQKLEVQNQRLIEYAYFNAHKVRGPVARILGLINLFDDGQLNAEKIIHNLKISTQELDKAIRDINDRLSD